MQNNDIYISCANCALWFLILNDSLLKRCHIVAGETFKCLLSRLWDEQNWILVKFWDLQGIKCLLHKVNIFVGIVLLAQEHLHCYPK